MDIWGKVLNQMKEINLDPGREVREDLTHEDWNDWDDKPPPHEIESPKASESLLGGISSSEIFSRRYTYQLLWRRPLHPVHRRHKKSTTKFRRSRVLSVEPFQEIQRTLTAPVQDPHAVTRLKHQHIAPCSHRLYHRHRCSIGLLYKFKAIDACTQPATDVKNIAVEFVSTGLTLWFCFCQIQLFST